jgi:hypothetical protein
MHGDSIRWSFVAGREERAEEMQRMRRLCVPRVCFQLLELLQQKKRAAEDTAAEDTTAEDKETAAEEAAAAEANACGTAHTLPAVCYPVACLCPPGMRRVLMHVTHVVPMGWLCSLALIETIASDEYAVFHDFEPRYVAVTLWLPVRAQ